MSAFSGIIRSAATLLPEVSKPVRKPSFNEKLVWTAIALVIYFIMSQISLYGVPSDLEDQFAATRVIFASSRGTLMELGIGPIVTAGLIMQLLKGAELIKLDLKKPEDRGLFMSATKLLTLVVIVSEAAAFLAGGLFGPNLTATTAVIIVLQLFVAGLVLVLLDELLQKGWGLGSGISLFILGGVGQQLVWLVFSVVPAPDGPLGFIPHLISSSMAGAPPSLMREGSLPSLLGLIFTAAVILFVVYVEGVRVEIPITSTKYRGFSGVYPIKFMYVSVLPVILVSALTANLAFFSNFLWARYNPGNTNPLFSWIATYDPANPGAGPTGGLMYYITSPRSLDIAAQDPLRTLFFLIFFVAACVVFAKIWVEIGGLSPKAAADSLIGADVQVPGFRRAQYSIQAILRKHIPVLTVLSGVIVGLLAAGGDLLGVYGSGTGILLAVSIVMNYYQILVRERLETVMPRLAGVLGRT